MPIYTGMPIYLPVCLNVCLSVQDTHTHIKHSVYAYVRVVNSSSDGVHVGCVVISVPPLQDRGLDSSLNVWWLWTRLDQKQLATRPTIKSYVIEHASRVHSSPPGKNKPPQQNMNFRMQTVRVENYRQRRKITSNFINIWSRTKNEKSRLCWWHLEKSALWLV